MGLYRVNGADRVSGKDTVEMFEAQNRASAELQARERGLLVSGVELISADEKREAATVSWVGIVSVLLLGMGMLNLGAGAVDGMKAWQLRQQEQQEAADDGSLAGSIRMATGAVVWRVLYQDALDRGAWGAILLGAGVALGRLRD